MNKSSFKVNHKITPSNSKVGRNRDSLTFLLQKTVNCKRGKRSAVSLWERKNPKQCRYNKNPAVVSEN